MNGFTCTRSWEAEALEDGRLGAGERLAFQRHVAGCAACRRRVAALEFLPAAMSHLPVPARSDMEHRRQRALLLERADRMLLRAEDRWAGGRSAAVAVTGVVALVAVIAAVGRSGRLRHPARVRVIDRGVAIEAPPVYEITGLQAAVWTRHESGGTARVTLSRGAAEFHVHHLSARQRFLVDVPDGEIEVRGTRFAVSVGERETRYLMVTEGKVVFRRHPGAVPDTSVNMSTRVGSEPMAPMAPMAPETILVAGDRWEGAPSVAVSVVASEMRRLASPDIMVPARRTGGSARPPRRSASRARDLAPDRAVPGGLAMGPGPVAAQQQPVSPRQQPDVASAAHRDVPGADTAFSQGVIALRAGQYDNADRRLAAFLAAAPGDARAEDAAFLRAVARVRVGDRQGAALLARDYLRRFPEGLRRPEAERLSAWAP